MPLVIPSGLAQPAGRKGADLLGPQLRGQGAGLGRGEDAFLWHGTGAPLFSVLFFPDDSPPMPGYPRFCQASPLYQGPG